MVSGSAAERPTQVSPLAARDGGLGNGRDPCDLPLESLRIREEGRPRGLAHPVGKILLVARDDARDNRPRGVRRRGLLERQHLILVSIGPGYTPSTMPTGRSLLIEREQQWEVPQKRDQIIPVLVSQAGTFIASIATSEDRQSGLSNRSVFESRDR